MHVRRATKYGFCAGVRVAEHKLREFVDGGRRVAILGPVVHNSRVVAEMESVGIHTVENLEDVVVPTVAFSAHGVPESYHQRADELGLKILDTTCTFVSDIHREAATALADGHHLVFFGDPKHREVVGYTHDLEPNSFHVVSNIDDARSVDWELYPKIKLVYQTTLNIENFEDVAQYIEDRNPETERADTICYATRENQDAARDLANDSEVEVILVIGGEDSANTRHLWEITSQSKRSYLIQGPEDIRAEWFEDVLCVGLTAGASTPDSLIDEVEESLRFI